MPKVDPKSTVLGKRKHNAKAKSVVKKRWKKMSILWELSYWKDIAVRHNIDLMHVKIMFVGVCLGHS